jgi:hypothetical protein
LIKRKRSVLESGEKLRILGQKQRRAARNQPPSSCIEIL